MVLKTFLRKHERKNVSPTILPIYKGIKYDEN